MLALLSGLARERPDRVEKPIELTAEGVWNEVSGRLREALNENTFSTWFAQVEAAEITDSEFVLAVPNEFTRNWIDGHFLDLITAAVGEIAGELGGYTGKPISQEAIIELATGSRPALGEAA